MENIELKYGEKIFNVSLEYLNNSEILDINCLNEVIDEEKVIAEALDNPIGSERLEDIVLPGQRICILISDVTRLWQRMDYYMQFIVNRLSSAGIKDEDIIFLSATGSHRKQTEEEHKMLLGPLASRFRVIDHDSSDKTKLSYMGKTSYGTPVYINKIALGCDHIIATGAIVFHDLAGWSGGKKSIIPGIAGYETIMGNHSLSMHPEFGKGLNPLVRCGNKENNPVHLDMQEGAEFIKPSFMFNVIIGGNGDIAKAVAGDYIKAHEVGCKAVDKSDRVYIKEKADMAIVSAGGYPKDINLYQASKALINAKEAVKEGGTIILLSQCKEGVGSDEMETIIRNFSSNIEREKEIRKNFSISKYTGYLITTISDKYKVILVSDIDVKTLNNSGITIVSKLDEALEIVYKYNLNKKKSYIIPYGASVLPTIDQ